MRTVLVVCQLAHFLLWFLFHSLLLEVSADVRFPDLRTESKNSRRMSGSVVDPMSSRESGESNDKSYILVEIGTQFLQRRVLGDVYLGK